MSIRLLAAVIVGCVVAIGAAIYVGRGTDSNDLVQWPEDSAVRPPADSAGTSAVRRLDYKPVEPIEPSGFPLVIRYARPWDPTGPPAEMAASWRRTADIGLESLDRELATSQSPEESYALFQIAKATLMISEGRPDQAHQSLEKLREWVEVRDHEAEKWLYTIIHIQGVAGLRRGENENCILCRGESSCILPISPAAVHKNVAGSRLAIEHFTEYLEKFPDDLGTRWLLNVAHMTLGEYPDRVDSRFLVSLDRFSNSEFDIGRFRDVGELVGVNKFNQAGGAILDDFDNDGRLDIVVTTMDPTESMSLYRNLGNGRFEDVTQSAGIADQFGGLYCVQTDYNNDGRLDIFIPRGAWLSAPMRPTLLRNDGDLKFTDVTEEAGLLTAVNSNSATWADYDNDGWLDLFICCERQASLLYHNLGNGRFEEVAGQAGLSGLEQNFCKGAAWIDFDNDNYPDLFLNSLKAPARLFRNNGNGTFSDATRELGIHGPARGFACWAWDYDNDGWLDIFAASYDLTLSDIVRGLVGEPHGRDSTRLYHNREGKCFEDVTREAGLDLVLATMGSNFGDFDNDGFLDMYLGTGDPSVATLVPNRMFKNVGGTRFAEITGSSGTGHLQKGHGVACGDWDRDGDIDVFIEMGGAINGDKYHNILFQNPGQGNNWLSVRLVGEKTNKAAIGARIKAVPAGAPEREIHRHVSSGSSFGANPLEQHLGLGTADRVLVLEIRWPTSGTVQVFRDIPANQAIEITELAAEYRRLDWTPIALPHD